MKANDDIPEDEMLLAEALAAAKARGLTFSEGARFKPYGTSRDEATSCCVLGALELAGHPLPPKEFEGAWIGNDSDGRHPWGDFEEDDGVSLGWAFRCAMTQEDG